MTKEQEAQQAHQIKPIKGYEGHYEVSEMGDVYSIKSRRIKLKPVVAGKYYHRVCLTKNNVPKSYLVHRLVLSSFTPNPENKPQVNHINGDTTDNRLCNLEWVTMEENYYHRWNILKHKPANLGKTGALHATSKRVAMLNHDGSILREFGSAREAGRILGINASSISTHLNGYQKTVAGHKWKRITDSKEVAR
jgi:hypothetical protein